jgi:Glycosyl transferases group 1
MNILFVMDKRVDRGSIQAAANYVRAGAQCGHTIALYGREEPNFPGLHFSTDIAAFDYVVFIIESSQKWMSGLIMPRILSAVPRERRAIVDSDGMYNQIVTVDGYDRNYTTERDRSQWMAHYSLLSDRILQTTLEPLEPAVQPLPFYGYDPASQIDAEASPPKQFDIMHVGHNWWRWREVSSYLLPAIEQVRAQVAEVCFVGSWWEAPPAGAKYLNLEKAFGVDPERFRQLRIRVKPAVPYTDVITTMSAGQVNIMTQRPLLRNLKILTSKYFEIFCADTIPLVMLRPDQAESVYGPAGQELALHNGISIADKLLDALHHPQKYQEIVREVRCYLSAHHSYRIRVQQLVAALTACTSQGQAGVTR